MKRLNRWINFSSIALISICVCLTAFILYIYDWNIAFGDTNGDSNYIYEIDQSSTPFSDSLLKIESNGNSSSITSSNDEEFVCTTSVDGYVDLTTGKLTFKDKITLLNNYASNKVNLTSISLMLNKGFSTFDGNWKLQDSDGNILFDETVGGYYPISNYYILPNQKKEVTITCDKEGDWDKSLLNANPIKFRYRYKLLETEAYVNYSTQNSENVITLYYDDMRSQRSGTNYDYTESISEKQWMTDNYASVTKCVVDQSFASYKPTSCCYLFGTSSVSRPISNLRTIDVTYLDTSQCTSFVGIFRNATNVTTYTGVNGLNTSSVSDFTYAFAYNTHSNRFSLSNWDMSSALFLGYMFENLYGSTCPDISSWNVSKVANTSYMFNGAELKKFCSFENWNFTNLKVLTYMFANCKNLTEAPKVSSWNTSTVTYAIGVFVNMGENNGSIKLTLNLKNWTFPVLTCSRNMFYNSTNLSKIYCNYRMCDVSSLTESVNMFYNCTSLDPKLGQGYTDDKTRAYPKTSTDTNGLFDSV